MIDKIVNSLKNANQKRSDFVKLMENFKDPYLVLIGCVLSLRTNDKTTYPATLRMLELAKTPNRMKNVSVEDLKNAIYPVGFYENKAKQIIEFSRIIDEEFNGIVPNTIEDLMSLAGVGRKTANVVRSVAFDIPSFAVDTHVNRVSKRLGLAKYNDSVEKVEEKLKRKIDRSRWNQGHHDFIFFGRYLCHSRNPECERCPFKSFCKKDKYEK